MKRIRLGCVVLAALATCWPGLFAAPELTKLVPASAPVVFHVRDIADLRTSWAKTSHAQAWKDAEIRKFLAPAIAMMEQGEDGFVAALKKDTGMTPEEFFALFSGEAIFAINDFGPLMQDAGNKTPQMLFAIECGESVGKVLELAARAQELSQDEGEEEIEEEFQGETLHITLETTDEGEREERQAWAIVDGVFMVAEPKAVLQEAIVAVKKGGVDEPFAEHPSLVSLYRKNPDTHVLLHVGLDSIVAPIVSWLESTEGQTDAEGNPTGPVAQLAQFGLTPEGLFHALGLDALRSFDSALTLRPRETVIEGDLTWTEQRGLLRVLAIGEPPVTLPDFIPDTWVSVSVDNFSLNEAWQALMTTLADVSPMFDGMVRQQIKQMNTQLGVDLERDLFGSLGDRRITAYAPVSGTPTADQPMDQFFALSLSNPDAFRSTLDTLIGRTPLAQMMQQREYLGESIRTMDLPNGKSVAMSVTRGYLFVSVGGSGMVESAIQGLQGGAARPFWKKAEVAHALDTLPDGASSIGVADLGQMLGLVADLLVEAASKQPGEQGESEATEGEESNGDDPMPVMIDPAARPSAETIEKYWSMMASAVYRTPNGFHFLLKTDHRE